MSKLQDLKNELESEMNADFIDWKKVYNLRSQIEELEHGNRSN